MSYQVAMYRVGFVDPQTQEEVFLNKVAKKDDQGFKTVSFDIVTHGEGFPSATKAKNEFLHTLNTMLTQEDYEAFREKNTDRQLPESCADFKKMCTYFGPN